jgi:hypothetical protein
MERAERSGGLHKRSAEDWGRGLSGARGEAPPRGFGCCFSGGRCGLVERPPIWLGVELDLVRQATRYLEQEPSPASNSAVRSVRQYVPTLNQFQKKQSG